jgi:hypothetical protein
VTVTPKKIPERRVVGATQSKTVASTSPRFIRISIDIGISIAFHESGCKRPKLSGNPVRRNSFRLQLRDEFPQSLYRLLLPLFARRGGLEAAQYDPASTSLQVNPPFVGEDAVSLSDCVEVNPEINR